MQADAVFKVQPTGNYVDHQGQQGRRERRLPAQRHGRDHQGRGRLEGDIKIVGETYTDNWDPANAQTEMEQFLTANSNKVDAVLSENDGMAGGVIAALKAQGLAGKVPVSGQDGDAAALNNVALGNQTVDVWKDARILGKTAGEAAVAALPGTTADKIVRRRAVHHPGREQPELDPPDPAADHQGQPQRRPRRRLDHQGQALRGCRRTGDGAGGLQVAGPPTS